MKTNLIVLFFTLLCYSCKSQNSTIEENIQDSILGTWRICVSFEHGLEQHPNHCPEMIFLENGQGILEASEPSSRFQWKIENNRIYFSFQTTRDKELFLSSNAVYTCQLYHERGLTFLKMITNESKSWYLLSK